MPHEKLNVKDIGFQITNACSIKCSHCSQIKSGEVKDLPAGKVIEVLTSNLFSYPLEVIMLSGGEPFSHKRFDFLLKAMLVLKFKMMFSKLAIKSNGYDTDRIIKSLRENSDYTRDIELHFTLEGFGQTHDKLTGVEGGFDKILRTIKAVMQEFPEIVIRAEFILSEESAKDISRIYRFCSQNNLKLYIEPRLYKESAGGKHEKRAFSKQMPFDEGLKDAVIKDLLEILETERSFKEKIVNFSYIGSLIKYLRGELQIRHCYTPKYDLFIDFNGYAYPCLYQTPSANITEAGWEEMFYKDGYVNTVEKAKTGECPNCLDHNGYLRCRNFNKKYFDLKVMQNVKQN